MFKVFFFFRTRQLAGWWPKGRTHHHALHLGQEQWMVGKSTCNLSYNQFWNIAGFTFSLRGFIIQDSERQLSEAPTPLPLELGVTWQSRILCLSPWRVRQNAFNFVIKICWHIPTPNKIPAAFLLRANFKRSHSLDLSILHRREINQLTTLSIPGK